MVSMDSASRTIRQEELLAKMRWVRSLARGLLGDNEAAAEVSQEAGCATRLILPPLRAAHRSAHRRRWSRAPLSGTRAKLYGEESSGNTGCRSQKRSQRVARSLKVSVVPVVITDTPNGSILERRLSFVEPAEFREWLESARTAYAR